MGSLADSFFNAEILAQALPAVRAGLWVTLQMTLAIIPTGIALGLALALVRVRRIGPLNVLIVIFVDVFRALPPLVILIVLYFALPYFDIQLSGFTAAWLGLSLVLAAFSEEIFWAGILSVDEGQWEAARATGLTSSATLLYVVLASSGSPRHCAAHEPRDRHRQGNGPRLRHRRTRDPQSSNEHPSANRQPVAADARGNGLPRALPSSRSGEPMGGIALWLEALNINGISHRELLQSRGHEGEPSLLGSRARHDASALGHRHPDRRRQRRGARDALQLAQAMASRSPHHLCRLGVDLIFTMVSTTYRHTIAGM